MKKIIFLLAAVLVMGAGCGKSAYQRVAENSLYDNSADQGVEGDENNDSSATYTYEDKSTGSSLNIGTGTLSPALAAEISLPAGAMIRSSMNIPGNIQLVYEVSAGSLAAAASVHEQQLKDKGWKQDSTFVNSNTVYQMYSQGTKKMQLAVYPATSGLVSVSLTLSGN